jgi:hypothetical protein
MCNNTHRHYKPICATIDYHLKHCPRHRGAPPKRFPSVKRTPDQLPDPWLFDSEALLRELDRCREQVLLIPAPTHAAHFAINNAVGSIWNLRENLRYLLALHRQGQRAWAIKTATKSQRKIKLRTHPSSDQPNHLPQRSTT